MFKTVAKIATIIAGLVIPSCAFAQTTVLDQVPAPVPSTGNSAYNSELLLQSYAITGGTLYQSILRQPGTAGQPIGVAQTFVPSAAGGLIRYLTLTAPKADTGVAFTASPGSGVFGVSRTAGTSLVLTGETTSSNAKTDKAMWELNLADSYVSGANVPVIVNANYSGSGTPTAATTTLTVAAYTEINGVETALTVTAAQQFTGTAANYTFTITGTGLVPGSHIVVEVVMLVTNATGANTGQINSIALQD